MYTKITKKGTTKNGQRHRSANRARRNGVAQAPPNYGLDFVDNAPIQRVATMPAPSSSPQLTKQNRTGLPAPLKTGVEFLSGYSMDDVTVHYNSPKPAQLQAHAYAQGNQIHLGPGQEKHLPHEAWHVVQQKQGRVQAKRQAKGMWLNDDTALEQEADRMGAKAIQQKSNSPSYLQTGAPSHIVQRKISDKLSKKMLNVVGEHHIESDARRENERKLARKTAKGDYWEENHFTTVLGMQADRHTLLFYRQLHLITPWLSRMLLPYKSQHGRIVKATKNLLKSEKFTFLIERAKNEYAQANRSQELKTKSKQVQNEFLQHFEYLKQIEQSLEELKNLSQEQEALVDTQYEKIETANAHMIKKFGTLKTVDKLRSKAMHRAAQEKKKTKGIWKIGQDHVDDIIRNPKWGEPDYNLIPLESFNKTYKEQLWEGVAPEIRKKFDY